MLRPHRSCLLFLPAITLLCWSPLVSAEGPSKAAESEVDDVPAVVEEVEENPLTAEQKEIADAAVAKPVSGEPIQVFGWREYVQIKGVPGQLVAKFDTGARTSSIHAEKQELFERDGRKWVRFLVCDPRDEGGERVRLEAPLVRVVHIKEPGGESVARQVVKLGLQIGERKLRAEFTLNNRSNMLAPVLIGRSLLTELGVVDPGRTHLAEQKIFR